ncbi:hypothetical protein GQX74_002863 [Glossina fuscipes]|nr:hypothetical protein GQX74_002863 [Glossina fuscipes]
MRLLSGRRQLGSNALASQLYRSSSFNSSGRSSNCDTTEDMYSDVSLENVQDISYKKPSNRLDSRTIFHFFSGCSHIKEKPDAKRLHRPAGKASNVSKLSRHSSIVLEDFRKRASSGRVAGLEHSNGQKVGADDLCGQDLLAGAWISKQYKGAANDSWRTALMPNVSLEILFISKTLAK